MSSTTSVGSGLTPGWRRSSRSAANGNCLEAAWRKSSQSYSDGHCTEAALRDSTVLVRDSKDKDGPVLAFSPAAWQAFLDRMRA